MLVSVVVGLCGGRDTSGEGWVSVEMGWCGVWRNVVSGVHDVFVSDICWV